MVVVVHGFPNKIAALQFEWAWQKPHQSRHFQSYAPNTYSNSSKHQQLASKLNVLADMVHLDQWTRWPLAVHITDQQVWDIFNRLPKLPSHFCLSFGEVGKEPCRRGLDKGLVVLFGAGYLELKYESVNHSSECSLCADYVDPNVCVFLFESCQSPSEINPLRVLTKWAPKKLPTTDLKHIPTYLICSTPGCAMVSHVECLATHFLRPETTRGKPNLLPVTGKCPACSENLVWGELVAIQDLKIQGEPGYVVDLGDDVTQDEEDDSDLES
ncbi:Structure-specific endonuclease subunit SLX1 [Chytriomyces hyalinus]|nr:Structure-specific endonuclease subunit SLX1 [Chytriomyces hyalinus]